MHLSCVQVCALLTLTLAAAAPPPHHVARRSFFNLQCKGVYDAAIFARLDRICDDCYNLFREPQLYSLCRWDIDYTYCFIFLWWRFSDCHFDVELSLFFNKCKYICNFFCYCDVFQPVSLGRWALFWLFFLII